DVIGDAQDQAAAELESAGFVVAVAEERPNDLDTPADHVLAQDLNGEARRGARVILTLSAGPRQVPIPVVVGDTREVAEAKLTDAGLVPDVSETYHEEVARGLVISTDPAAGEVLDETSTVSVVVSRGPQPIAVPGVIGVSEAEARAILDEAGLGMRVVERAYDAAPAGTVINQNPAEGHERVRGDVVDVAVSDGPAPIEVPSVRDMLADEAVATLKELGFEVVVERRGGFGAFLRPNRVFDQDPAPGADRYPGDTITVYAYEG
ncbi:MAG TPA: PASTA domain-containing protein, partial [Egicoccus sp.]